MYKFLTTGIIGLHLGYVGFVVVAQLLILVGIACRWKWTRNLRFRVIHLIMTEIVALEGLFNVRCPMTDWQDRIEASARAANAPPAEIAKQEPQQPPPEYVKSPPNPGPVEIKSLDPGTETKQNPGPPPPRNVENVVAPPPKNAENIVVAPAPPQVEPPAPPPVLPDDPQPPPEDATTFVGRLLNAILFVPVDQTVLDRWYVRFGGLTLLIFVAFPPRLGAWSVGGLTGALLLWTGALTAFAAWYDLEMATPPYPPRPMQAYISQSALEFGIVMALMGSVCLLLARRRRKFLAKSQAPGEAPTTS